jgi:hypothetical protein
MSKPCLTAWGKAGVDLGLGTLGGITSVGLCATAAGCVFGAPAGIASAGKFAAGVDWLFNGSETTDGTDPVKKAVTSFLVDKAGMSGEVQLR